jgi:hypothetical protein
VGQSGILNEEDGMASRQKLGSNTVKFYVRSGYSKIGLDTRSMAILWALDQGLGATVESHEQSEPRA